MNTANVQYNQKELLKIVLTNFTYMLERRKLIDNPASIIDNFDSSITFNKSIKIKTLNSHVLAYIINDKVSSVTQNSPIDDFLSSNTNINKFVIIDDPSKKTFKQITEQYPNSEVFFLEEFLEDIPAKFIIPKHILLSECVSSASIIQL